MDRTMAENLAAENGRRSIQSFVEPLQRARGIQSDLLGAFEIGTQIYSLPRFTFGGPNSTDPIRIGIFAAIHGDEPAGALAASKFLLDLVNAPETAENF